MYMYYDSNCQDYLFKSSTSTKLKQKIKTGIQKIHVLNLQLYIVIYSYKKRGSTAYIGLITLIISININI